MQNAEKISVTVTPDMLRAESVEAGEYATTTEALRDTVPLWQRDCQERAARIAQIRGRIQRSYDDPRCDLTAGEVEAHMRALFDGGARHPPA